MRIKKPAGRVLVSVLVVALFMASSVQAKGKGYSGKAGGTAYHVKCKTGDLVEITATDVHPPGSKTRTEIENETKEERDKITNGQAGDPDDAGDAWKQVLGIGDDSIPQEINGRTAMLTPEALEDLLRNGIKLPSAGDYLRTPDEQNFLDMTGFFLASIKDIVAESKKGLSGGSPSDSKTPEERLQDMLDQVGDLDDLVPIETEKEPKISKKDLEGYEEYAQDANDEYVLSTNARIKKDPGAIADISASNVADSETDKDTFCWREVSQTNSHYFGLTKKTSTFLEYTGFCSYCYDRAKKELTAMAEDYEKQQGKKLANLDRLIEATAREYARYSRTKLCHCGKFIRCDSLTGGGKAKYGFVHEGEGAYDSKYGTDIRVDKGEDGKYEIDSFYMQDGNEKSGENNFTSLNHTFKTSSTGMGELSMYTRGYGLYDNFTGEMIYSPENTENAGKNMYVNGLYYSEKTANLTLSEAYALAEKNGGTGTIGRLITGDYYKTANVGVNLDELSKLDNADNRTIGDLIKEAYGGAGERVYQVQRANAITLKDGFQNYYYPKKKKKKKNTDNTQESETENIPEGETEAPDFSLPEDGTGTGSETGGRQGTGTGSGGGQTPGETGQDTGTGSGSGQKPGGTNPSSGTGTNPDTPGGDENKDGVFDAKDVLIRLYGGAGGMEGVRKNVHYQELLKKFKDENDLMMFINGLIESGYIEKGKTPSEWMGVLGKEVEEFARATSEEYKVNYYYSSSGERTIGQEKEYNLIINYKYDILDKKTGKALIEGITWGGGSTYWVPDGAGEYVIKRYAEVWPSITKTVQVTETLKVTDSNGNELYNRTWTDTRIDSYGLKEKPSHWTNEGIRDIVVEVEGGESQMFATSRVH